MSGCIAFVVSTTPGRLDLPTPYLQLLAEERFRCLKRIPVWLVMEGSGQQLRRDREATAITGLGTYRARLNKAWLHPPSVAFSETNRTGLP